MSVDQVHCCRQVAPLVSPRRQADRVLQDYVGRVVLGQGGVNVFWRQLGVDVVQLQEETKFSKYLLCKRSEERYVSSLNSLRAVLRTVL